MTEHGTNNARRQVVHLHIRLTERQLSELRRLAKSQGLSVAELIRRCVDQVLASRAGNPDVDAAFVSALGSAKGGPSDMAEKHDDYLAEAVGQ